MRKGYYKYKIENLIVVNEIVTIHDFKFDKNFFFGSESHDFWEVVYAEKNVIICGADEKNIILNEGEILFHKPNESHTLSADGVSSPKVCIISFVCKSEAMRFFEDKKFKLSVDKAQFITKIIDEGKNTFNTGKSTPETTKMELLSLPSLGGQQMIKNYLEIFLVELLRENAEDESSDAIFLYNADYKMRTANRIIDFLTKHVYDKVSMDDLSEELSYNKSYLFREFKKATGRSIMAYFRKLKLSEAKKLLRQSDLNVTEISEKLQYESPDYFTKTFKKSTSLTPLQYRKRRGK